MPLKMDPAKAKHQEPNTNIADKFELKYYDATKRSRPSAPNSRKFDVHPDPRPSVTTEESYRYYRSRQSR